MDTGAGPDQLRSRPAQVRSTPPAWRPLCARPSYARGPAACVPPALSGRCGRSMPTAQRTSSRLRCGPAMVAEQRRSGRTGARSLGLRYPPMGGAPTANWPPVFAGTPKQSYAQNVLHSMGRGPRETSGLAGHVPRDQLFNLLPHTAEPVRSGDRLAAGPAGPSGPSPEPVRTRLFTRGTKTAGKPAVAQQWGGWAGAGRRRAENSPPT